MSLLMAKEDYWDETQYEPESDVQTPHNDGTLNKIDDPGSCNVRWDRQNNDRGRGSSSSSSRGAGRREASWRGREWRRGGGQYEHGQDSSRSFSDRRNNSEPLVISISSRDVGKIIGKGGATIKEIQEKSRARIKVDSYADDSGESCVKIFGDEKCQETAEDLINDLINDLNQQDRPHCGFSKSSWGSHGSNQSSNLPIAPKLNVQVDWAQAAKEYEEYQKTRWNKCPDLKKNFYIEDPYIATMIPNDVARFRMDNNNIMASWMDPENKSKPVPNPIMTFEQAFRHFPEILDELDRQGFERPSPIQAQAWPILLQGMDLIGIAQTGTGKTLAFLLPALIHIDNQLVPRDQRGGPNVLILAPTRELALQIERESNKLNYKDIKSVCVYGGGDRRTQIGIVEKGVQIVIATPGRLNDLVMAKVIDVSSITYLILDEADRMLDMGFEPQIKKILLDIRPDRQTVMTSATWPEGVRRLANQYMRNPVQVCVGSLDLAAVHSVQQIVEIISQEDKFSRVFDFIYNMEPDDKIIIFVGKKAMADHLSSELAIKNIECECIHGDREQSDREGALEQLKLGEVRILVATDVASRGLDIKDITHVFNYDFPRNTEEYVHRVGRTGRAGRTGMSITLFTREDWSHAKELISILEESNQVIPDELFQMAERFAAMRERTGDRRGGFCGRSFGREGGGGGGGGGGGYGRRDGGRGNRW